MNTTVLLTSSWGRHTQMTSCASCQNGRAQDVPLSVFVQWDILRDILSGILFSVTFNLACNDLAFGTGGTMGHPKQYHEIIPIDT